MAKEEGQVWACDEEGRPYWMYGPGPMPIKDLNPKLFWISVVIGLIVAGSFMEFSPAN